MKTSCGTQSILGFLTGQNNIDCPDGMLPVRDPATGDWARHPQKGCFLCTEVSVIDPKTQQPRPWKGTQSGGVLPTALMYNFPEVFTTTNQASSFVWIAGAVIIGMVALSLVRGRR